MSDIPGYAAAVWFDTYVRERLGNEKSIQKIGENLFSRYHQDMFEQLAKPESELAMREEQIKSGVMYIIIDSVLRFGAPVSNRYCGREVSDIEKECIELDKKVPKVKGDQDGPLGVG